MVSKRYIEITMGSCSGYTIGLLLKIQIHAVQAAVTDHITLTEVICFNSLLEGQLNTVG